MRPESRAALGHLLDTAHEIESVTSGKTLKDYEEDRYLRAIVERFFITIGEALSRIDRHDPELFEVIPGARSIVGFRNVLVHGYDAIDADQVWAAVTDDLGHLIGTVRALLNE